MRKSGGFKRERNKQWLSSKCAKWLTVFVTGILFASCSQQAGQSNAERPPSGSAASQAGTPNKNDAGANLATAGSSGNLPLRTLTDISLTGGATRLDYQSLDSESGRLYIAHIAHPGSDLMTVFDVNKQTIVGDVKDLKRVHGVLAVPELHRVYATGTWDNRQRINDLISDLIANYQD